MRQLVRTKQQIRAAARESLLGVYNRRNELIRRGANFDEVLAIGANLVALINDFRIVRMPELPTRSIEDRVFADSATAGIIDRRRKEIYIATRCPPRTQRFTLGHEIGHLVLHPLELYHRDRPLVGAARSNVPLIEREADIFSAELLMPHRHLKRVFERNFAGAIAGERADQELAYNLSCGTARNVSASELIEMGPWDRALLFARCTFWGGRTFQSLVDRYNVSSSAMAWQLCDHGLVS
jgi:hypothetical protein